ncbi:Protein of unknown function [Gryllus bimaculatus]|nr:Protein of unknown function [Gryllus bimaculatus]
MTATAEERERSVATVLARRTPPPSSTPRPTLTPTPVAPCSRALCWPWPRRRCWPRRHSPPEFVRSSVPVRLVVHTILAQQNTSVILSICMMN